MGHRDVDEIAAGGVHDALGRAGRARCVKDEQRVFRVHRLRRTIRCHRLFGFVQPDVAPGPPCDVAAGVPDDDHRLDAAGFFGRRVDIGLERHLPAAAKTFVRGDHDLGFGVGDAAGEGVGREAAEHHRMDGADARASEHRVSRLGNHRQIDGDAIALPDAAAFQHVGETAHPIRKLGIGDVLRLRGIVALPDDRGLARALGQMPIDAIVRDIGDAVLEPLDRDIVGVEGRVLDPGIGLEPVDALAVLGPEAFRIADRSLVHLLILGRVDKGALRPFGRNVINFVGHGAPPDTPDKQLILIAA